MTPEQILDLVASGESETLELKATTGTRREAPATVCAMLNQRGGHVLFAFLPMARRGPTGHRAHPRGFGKRNTAHRPPSLPAIERVPLSRGREAVRSWSSRSVAAHRRLTSTGELPIVGLATPRAPCSRTNTTGCSLNACAEEDAIDGVGGAAALVPRTGPDRLGKGGQADAARPRRATGRALREVAPRVGRRQPDAHPDRPTGGF